MSLEATPDGGVKVRWYDGTKHRSKKFAKGEKTLAKAFDGEVKRAKRHGTLQVLQVQLKSVQLGELGAEWWEVHGQNKADSTQRFYAWTWNSLIAPHLGDRQVASLTPADIESCFLQMNDRGAAVRRKAMTLLHQILNYGIKKGYLVSNPVAVADKPALATREPLVIPPPRQVEQIRKALPWGDAVAVEVMAYAGLRPNEAFRLERDDILNGKLRVRDTKRKRTRYPILLPLLREDLEGWLSAHGSPLVFPSSTGQPFTRFIYNNWRRRVFGPAAPAGVTPYSLRHAFVSLLLRDPAYSRVEIAEWAGHSLEVQDKVYRHVIEDGEGNAEEAIRMARMEVFGD